MLHANRKRTCARGRCYVAFGGELRDMQKREGGQRTRLRPTGRTTTSASTSTSASRRAVGTLRPLPPRVNWTSPGLTSRHVPLSLYLASFSTSTPISPVPWRHLPLRPHGVQRPLSPSTPPYQSPAAKRSQQVHQCARTFLVNGDSGCLRNHNASYDRILL